MDTKRPDPSWDEDDVHDEHGENDKGGDATKLISAKRFFFWKC